MWTATYVNNELRRGVTKFLQYVQKGIKSERGQYKDYLQICENCYFNTLQLYWTLTTV